MDSDERTDQSGERGVIKLAKGSCVQRKRKKLSFFTGNEGIEKNHIFWSSLLRPKTNDFFVDFKPRISLLSDFYPPKKLKVIFCQL